MVSTDIQQEDALAPCPEVSLHFLGDEGVLFDAPRQKLYTLNTAATFAWCCLEENLAPGEVSERLSRTFKFQRREAETYLERIIAEWRGFGVIAGSGSVARDDSAEAPSCWPPGSPFDAGTEGRRKDPAERDYSILGQPFRLRLPSAVQERRPEPLLASLAMPARPGSVPITIEIRRQNAGYVLTADCRAVERCDSLSETVPMIRASLLQLALHRSRDFAAVHASAVGDGKRCVLLPAAAGVGKSTLAAGLVASGFQLLGDDTIVLTGPDLSVRAIPFAVCVKEGAWMLLSRRFPALLREPVHCRPDGQRVRYLPLDRASTCADPEASMQVSAIVFLNREPGATAALSPVAAPEALRRLLRGFHPLGDGLDIAKVERLLKWVAGTDRFELKYSSLDDGVARIREFFP